MSNPEKEIIKKQKNTPSRSSLKGSKTDNKL